MLGYDQRVRILQNVILGVKPSKSESDEAAEQRKAYEKDKAAADAAGYTLEIPLDWEDRNPLKGIG